ncbi:ABC transporter ATP-binding protein/permease [Lysinibacillus xylanilyticus]|uniref:ABC transporter ATP-binding protein n=1 Tax=Lysinibacillus xylanilyticus TaxID=582475 RepID=UPI002B24A3D8|nr:ABC transporter ATP-binding protein [Lysinibacillus xylanilyticus]MEB2278916.1 ABC transporter ATP-binding protein/permease [Lysinibacillus xylanilyticus]
MGKVVKQNKNPIFMLLSWAGKDKKYLYLSVLCSFISGLSTILPYFIIYQIIEQVYHNNLTEALLIQHLLILAISIIVRFGLFAISGTLSHKGAYRTLFKVRCQVTEHMAQVPLGSLNERNTGEIKTLLNEEIEKLELFLAHHLPEFVFYMSGPVAVFIYLCTVNISLALISFIPLIVAVAVLAIMFRGTNQIMDRAARSIANLNAIIIEYIQGMRLIKAYNMSSSSFKKFTNAVDDEFNIWKEMSLKMGPPYASFVIIIECGLLLMVPIGGMWFLNGSLTGSVFILFAFVGSLYLTELRPLQELGSNFAQVLNAVKKCVAFLETPVFGQGQAFPNNYNIELRNVNYSYDGQKEHLKNVNLSIAENEKIAIVGNSGSGKSTIVQLISRFNDVQQGEVLIGNHNVKDIDYEELLKNITTVFQKTFLTSGTVFENIVMGSNATMDEVRTAAKKAQIDDFIISLPDGYDTRVGSFGTRFSGGEKQRIAIARAILKDAPILILDEATSAADPENQAEIDQAIAELCVGKTVIIIAHRLGIIKHCDRVAIVENQTLQACGTHQEMLEESPSYKKTWQDYSKAREITYEF